MPKNNSHPSHAGPFASLILATAALLLSACGKDQGGPPPLPEVSIITLKARSIAITDQLPGRTTAFRVAEVRPQVTGIVQKRLFAEGSEVKAGEQLFQIDSGSYRAALSSAQAALKRAEAQAVSARLLEERYAPLIAANAVSKQENDDAIASRARAEADVASARAAVDAARINVVYTQVLSPITGQIGRTLVTEGALVTSGQQSPLATVQQLDPIYVDIAQSSTEMLRLQRQLAAGELVKDDKNQAEVSLTLEDGSVYPERGRLKVSEASVDPSTGSVLLRAVFPNPRRELLPGCSCARNSRRAHARRRCSSRSVAFRIIRAAKPRCSSSITTTRWRSAWSPPIAPSRASGSLRPVSRLAIA